MCKRFLSLAMASLILFSCASSYKPILPAQMSYSLKEDPFGISYGYRYNVLAESGNKKYTNKENKRGVRLIAIQVQNNTDRVITLREDAKFYMGDRIVFPMDPKQIQHQIKQPGGLYMLWSLLWLTISNCNGNDCNVTPIPIGLVIGLINLGTASGANKNLLTELTSNNILDRHIQPGEKTTGLIGIGSDQSSQLEIRLQ